MDGFTFDLLKQSSSTDDQMDTMMMMMMQLPEFYGAYGDAVADLPPPEFSGAANTVTSGHGSMLHFIDNAHTAASSFTDLPSSTISFTNPTSLLQDQSPPPYSSNSIKESWRGTGELSGANAYATATASEKRNSMAAMREMIFRIAAMQPINIDPESVKPPKRRNVKISKDPQSVAARHRRERISERIRILQRLVPGGTKMDTASMLDEAIHYVKFLKTQVQSLERAAANRPPGIGFTVAMSTETATSYLPLGGKPYQPPQNLQHY